MNRTINKRLEKLTKVLKGIFTDEFDEEEDCKDQAENHR